MAFSPEEKQIIDKMKAQGKTPTQIAGYIGGLRTNSPSTVSRALGEAPKEVDESVLTRIVKDAPSDIIETGKNMFNAVNDAGKANAATLADKNLGIVDKAVTVGANTFKGIGRFLGETFLGAAKTVATTDKFEKDTVAAANEVGQAVAKTDLIQDTVKWYESQDDNKKRQIQNILGYAEGLAELGGAGVVVKGIKKGVDATKTAASMPADIFNEVFTASKQGKVSPSIRLANEAIDETTRTKAIDSLSEIYNSSMVQNRQSINNKLDELANLNSFGDKKVTKEDLVRNLSSEGYVPDVEKGSRLADFRGVYEDIDARQMRVMEALKPVLENSKVTVTPTDFFAQIKTAVQANPQIISGLSRADSALDTYMAEVMQKFGTEKLTASQVNEIRKNANANTKAFKDSDKFEADLWSLIGKESRRWLDENVPEDSVRQANAEWARLNTLRETADIFNNQQIDVGVWGRALGSYMTAIGGTAVGGIAAGPIGAVTVGILTKMGGDALADMLRQKAFDPKVVAQIRQTMRQDDELVEKLIATADQQSKDSIKDFLLPAPGESSYRSEINASKPINMQEQTTSTRDANERLNPAIKSPGTTKFLQLQAERYKTPESFVAAVRNNPAWLAKFEEMGTTPEDVSKLAFAGKTAYKEAAKQNVARIGDRLLQAMDGSNRSVSSIVNQAKKDFGMSTEEAEMLKTYLNDATLGMMQ